MTEKRDPVDIFCNIGIFTFTSTMVYYYLRLSRIRLLQLSDTGIFLICTATILMFLSLKIAGHYKTRNEIITAMVFMIAAEKDLSDKPELLTEYRRTLAEHAMFSGRPRTHFVEIAEELINNDRINF